MVIQRTEYLNFLMEWKEQQIIKVVTGIRRCGKSTLFDLFRDYLQSIGVHKTQIISINFEEAENENLCEYHALYDYVKSKMIPDKMNYIFLDEIQHVTDYQKAVDSLFVKKNADVYITGSNAYFMSGELATLLSGRYIELKMLPLSFKEYIDYLKLDCSEKSYLEYINKSSFPYTLNLETEKDIDDYLDSLYNTIIVNISIYSFIW